MSSINAGTSLPPTATVAKSDVSPVAAAPKAAPQPVEKSATSLQDVANRLSNALQGKNLSVGLGVDNSSGKAVILVSDSSSGELIRQIPSEEALKRAETFEQATSFLLEKKA